MNLLKPYQVFDAREIVKEIDDDYQAVQTSDSVHRPAVVSLSGPPGAGKSHLAKFLSNSFGLAAAIVNPSAGLYTMMRMAALPETQLTYEEFKKLPHGRAALIHAAKQFLSIDPHVFNKFCVSLDSWSKHTIVIVDNIGFSTELDFFDSNSIDMVHIEIMQPFEVTLSPDRARQEEPYVRAVNKGSIWPGDSRSSMLNEANARFKTDQVMGFISSQFAIQQLNRQVFQCTAQNVGVAGSTYGRLYQMKLTHWVEPPPPAAVGDLFDDRNKA